jgi:hypothetical protein
MKNRLLDFLYRRTFLCCVLYRWTVAYRRLFPNGRFLDPESPYVEEIVLIRRAIRCPSYRLEEMNMGIVLSQLIQSEIGFDEGYVICAMLNDSYADRIHYMNRWDIVRCQLEHFWEKHSN